MRAEVETKARDVWLVRITEAEAQRDEAYRERDIVQADYESLEWHAALVVDAIREHVGHFVGAEVSRAVASLESSGRQGWVEKALSKPPRGTHEVFCASQEIDEARGVFCGLPCDCKYGKPGDDALAERTRGVLLDAVELFRHKRDVRAGALREAAGRLRTYRDARLESGDHDMPYSAGGIGALGHAIDIIEKMAEAPAAPKASPDPAPVLEKRIADLADAVAFVLATVRTIDYGADTNEGAIAALDCAEQSLRRARGPR